MEPPKPVSNKKRDADIRSVLEGRLEHLPTPKSTQIRVFFSSTFTDMAVERNTLMKEVVPFLTQTCKHQGLEFEVVDMRWGVRDETQVDQTTTALLLREIHKCQNLSIGPNFVMFLGDRYGSHVLPSQILVPEFKILKNIATATGRDTSLLDKWFTLDMNAEPSVYQLQPITKHYPYYTNMDPSKEKLHEKAREDWQSTEKQLLSNLQQLAEDAFNNKKMSAQQYEKYFESVTEMEIRAGALDAPTVDRVLCFQRSINDIDTRDKLAGRFVDLTESGEIDELARERRERLQKEKVASAVPADQIFTDSVAWTEQGIDPLHHEDYLRNLADKFRQAMLEKINKCMLAESLSPKDKLYHEILRNLHFFRQKCKIFYGREDELKRIREASMHVFSDHPGDEDKEKTLSDSVGSKEQKRSTIDASMIEEMTDRDGVENSVMTHGGKEDDDPDVDKLDDDDEEGEDDSDQAEKERNSIAEMCKSVGVLFHYGDAYDDFESDPDKNPQLRLTTLPAMPHYRRPVIVYGPSGSGKTALMARVFHLSVEWMCDSYSIVRFLGTSPHCSYIRDVLNGLCQHVSRLYGISMSENVDLNSDFQFLVAYFHALLWRIDTVRNPLMIILDSVDQLHATDHAHTLAWMPKKLPPNVAMVISMVPSIHNCLHNSQVQFPFLDHYIELSSFAESDAAEVINLQCYHSNRCITRQQKNYLLKKFTNCRHPLFLKLIVDEALTWNSYTQTADIRIGKTIELAINDLFDKLERNHGNVLISHAFAYLSAASHGVSDTEMEDLLSLDDEVLQDSYLYHLPPDSLVVRLPPLLWRRVADDIRQYIVQRKSGNWFVITWYHRQFRDVAQRRFLTPDIRSGVHTRMCEYFMGVWHDKVKPLELFKIKKGSYPEAKRRVPDQPLVFEKGGYNTRKLQELPWHLINSGNFKQFREITCCFQWLLARCHTQSLSAVVEDLKMALNSPAFPETDQEIRDDIKFIFDMLALGNDSIRKDSKNLAVQIVGQVSPHVCSSSHLLQLFREAHDWLVTNDNPQLIPQTVCLPRPGGVLKSSFNVDVHIQGSDRDFRNCMVFNEEKQQLVVIQQQSRSYHDNLHVYDVHDNLTCMQVEKLPFNIRGVDLVGQNRFLLLQVYDQMSRYTPKYHSALFEGTTSSPVTVTADATIISVSKSGNLLLYNRDNTVMVADWDITSSTFKNRLSLDMEEKPGYVVMSPDEQHVITVSVETRQQLWSTATGKRLAALAESDTNIQSFEEYAPSNRTCLITSSNMYVHRGWSYQTSSVIFCYSLPSGNLLGSVKSPSSHYEVDIIALDKNQQYIIYGTSAGVLINGDKNKYATVAELLTRTVKSSCRRVNGPYSDLKLCGDEELFVVAAVCGEADIYILSAGRRGNLKNQAQLVFNVTGHSQGVLQLIITSNENMLFSAGEDNSVKLWDFDKIMAGIRNKSAQTQLNGVVHRNKGTNDVIDKAAKSKLENWDDNSAVDVVGRTLSLVISSDCESLYLATDKGFLLKRKLKAQTTTMIDTPTSEPANQLLLSKNNKYLCAAIGGNVLVFDTSTDGLLYALEARGKVSCMAEGGDVLVAGQAGMEAQGRIWNLQTGAKIRDFEFLYSLYKTAVNSIGTKICVTMFDYPVMLSAVDCAADDGAILQQPDTMMAACSAMMISPNDLLAAAGSSDGSTRVISTTTGKYLFRMNQRSSVTTSAFTPDSRSLLTAGYRSIYIWDMQDGHLECKLTRHEDFVVNLRFARDGRLLVTSGRDKMIVVWNMEERVSVCVFLAHCHLDILDVAHDLSYIAYGSEIVSLVGVLEPNKVLKSMADGSYVKTVPEQVKKAQSLALSFSGQRVKLQTTSACSIV